MLDRMDIFVEVPRVEYDKLIAPRGEDTSEMVQQRAASARTAQLERFGSRDLASNAEMGPVEVWDH